MATGASTTWSNDPRFSRRLPAGSNIVRWYHQTPAGRRGDIPSPIKETASPCSERNGCPVISSMGMPHQQQYGRTVRLLRAGHSFLVIVRCEPSRIRAITLCLRLSSGNFATVRCYRWMSTVGRSGELESKENMRWFCGLKSHPFTSQLSFPFGDPPFCRAVAFHTWWNVEHCAAVWLDFTRQKPGAGSRRTAALVTFGLELGGKSHNSAPQFSA
jgi:hypothetical protein